MVRTKRLLSKPCAWLPISCRLKPKSSNVLTRFPVGRSISMSSKISANDFRQMSEAEIQDKLNEAKAELFNLRIQHSISQLTNPSRISVVKRDIARMKTVLR